MTWQPIESAPATGLVLLAVKADGDSERRTFVAEQSYNERRGEWEWQITIGWGGWSRLLMCWEATHWMPLPQPPEVTA